jgi:2-phospho-L-lactate guanylyltransferase
MDAGILAVKRLDQAKQRLGTAFSESERREIAGALFEDALVLCAGTEFLRWWVVSDDPEVLDAARERGLGAVQDPGEALNQALTLGIAAASLEGAGSVTIVPADLPLARPEDIEAILDTGVTSEMVIVPSGDGGTNALYLRPPDLIEPRFGESSLKAHLAIAEERKLRCSVLALERMALDIDTELDARRLVEIGAPEWPSRTELVLSRLRPPEAEA